MTALRWMPELELPLAEFNAEHHELLEALNEVLRALVSHSRPRITLAFGNLKEIASRHFRTEEGRMQAAAYPDAAVHCAAHRELLERVDAYRRRFSAPHDPPGAPSPEQFLRRWLVGHITHDDRALAQYLRRRGL